MSRPSGPGTARRRSSAFRIATLLLIAAALAGCGRKANPIPPPGEPVTYPQQYPKT
jgi:predicted small lipoprotein YifL